MDALKEILQLQPCRKHRLQGNTSWLLAVYRVPHFAPPEVKVGVVLFNNVKPDMGFLQHLIRM